MIRKTCICGFLLAAASLATILPAQKGEVVVDYSLIVYNPAKSYVGDRDLHGGGASFGYNFNRYFQFKAEFQGYTSTTLTFTIPVSNPGGLPPGVYSTSASAFTYLFGPQIDFPRSKTRLFGEALFGGAYNNVYGNFFNAAHVVGASPSNNGFAMAFGGGFDIPVAKHVMIRPAQLDYFLTRYNIKQLGTNNQSNFRYQAGIVIGFGGY